MSTIVHFEDLETWQKARILSGKIYSISNGAAFSKDFELKGQIRSAAVSVMSNIAEGYERGGDKEFVQFLSLAKGSCGEVRSQLYVALDQQYIRPDEFADICAHAKEVSRLIAGLMKYLQQSSFRGSKYKHRS
ncbi:MAG TPA: four helix bundle protein [Verrucomicrobia bacterium]|nr:MAG: four helix bundle protein [Lentisphaerae bacterium GWF2_57_35]HBA84448.1 four helix bundle protein [Verrucomicrobiota bacterium]